jgi:peroxiredoxin
MTATLETTLAPDFTLVDQTGRTVRLSEYRGRNVVLVFNRGLL